MPGGPYLDPHPRDEDCDEHTQNIVIICNDDRNCFGEPVLDIVSRAYKNVHDYGDSIKSRETVDGYRLFEKSVWSHPEEQRDAQCRLLGHSLWIIEPELLLENEYRVGFSYQIRALPDQTRLFTWIGDRQSGTQVTRDEIESHYPGIRIAEAAETIESWVASYLDFGVNPKGSEQTVIEWSNDAAEAIDKIRP